MSTPILLPLDGSPLAETAIPYAAALAHAARRPIVVVRVAHLVGVHLLELTVGQAAAVEEAEAYATGVAARLAAEGLEVSTAVPFGDAAPAIVTEIGYQRAGLVVMATHGRSGLGRLVYGSVAEGVLAASPVPVVMVPAGARRPSPADLLGPDPGLLVPLDQSALAEAVLGWAVDLARSLGGHLVLSEVVVPLDAAIEAETGEVIAYVDQRVDDDRAQAQSYLEHVAGRLRASYPAVRVETAVEIGQPTEGILDAVRERGAGLIVMATHGRTGLNRLIAGSVALDVVRQGTVPVMLVRPFATAPARRRARPSPQPTLAPTGPGVVL